MALDPDQRTVTVHAVLVDAEVHRILSDLPAPARADLLASALRFGIVALRDATTVGKADYVEKEFSRMRGEFQAQIAAMRQETERVFGEQGEVDRRMQAFFGPDGRFARVLEEFLGPDGRLPRALDERIGEDGDFHRTLEEFLGDGGRLRQELDSEFGPDGGRLFRAIDPADERTPLGRLRRTLEDRFDPAREGSALHDLKRDLREEIERLRRDLGVKAAREEERAKGHDKGFDFQDHVLGLLLRAAPQGDRVEDVSKVKGPLGDVGDALCTLDTSATAGAERRIVVEAKHRPVTLSGQRSIHKELEEAMRNRDAHFAIAAVHVEHAGKFAPLRYCAPDQLLVAVGEDDDALPLQAAYLVARALLLSRASQREAQLDVGAVTARLQQINGHLESVRAMKTGLTGAVTSIEKVAEQLDDLRAKVRGEVGALLQEIGGAGPGTVQATLPGALSGAIG